MHVHFSDVEKLFFPLSDKLEDRRSVDNFVDVCAPRVPGFYLFAVFFFFFLPKALASKFRHVEAPVWKIIKQKYKNKH